MNQGASGDNSGAVWQLSTRFKEQVFFRRHWQSRKSGWGRHNISKSDEPLARTMMNVVRQHQSTNRSFRRGIGKRNS